MSREIKFRAWNKKGKCWITFGGVNYKYENGTLDIVDSDNLIYEQYTGLKDKNGKEIYEGDIIKQLMYVLEGKECVTTWLARWNNDEFCYDLHRVAGAMYGDSMLSTCESESCEVIGNIHENKELLGGKE